MKNRSLFDLVKKRRVPMFLLPYMNRSPETKALKTTAKMPLDKKLDLGAIGGIRVEPISEGVRVHLVQGEEADGKKQGTSKDIQGWKRITAKGGTGTGFESL
ncbi:MAG: hypothetical protein ACJ763_18510 [Bdellovibrionia bacterium]